jgi:hypothetical protein
MSQLKKGSAMTTVKKMSPEGRMLARRGIRSAEAHLLTDPKIELTTDGDFSYKLAGSPPLMLGKTITSEEVNRTLNSFKYI